MKWFLRAPHWKIFLIQLSPALLIPFVVLAFFLSIGTSEFDPSHLGILILIPFLILGSMAFHICYLWSIGNKLQPLLPEGVSHSPKYFNIALCVPFVGMAIGVVIGIGFLAQGNFDTFDTPEFPVFPFVLFIFYFLFALVAMIGGFYQIYFLAKMVKTLELQREVRFEEYLLECVLFWFYIVGLWIIQPKINEFVERLDNPPPAPPPIPAESLTI